MAMHLLKPPMGWNAWNYFGWEITDKVRIRDCINHVDLGEFSCGAFADVPARSAIVWRATRI